MKQYCWSSCKVSFVIGVTALFQICLNTVILKMVKVLQNWCVLCGVLHLPDEYVLDFNYTHSSSFRVDEVDLHACWHLTLYMLYAFFIHNFWNSAASIMLSFHSRLIAVSFVDKIVYYPLIVQLILTLKFDCSLSGFIPFGPK